MGQALHDRRLAHAGFPYEHRIVLGAPRQDLHDPLKFGASPDHRVELVLASHLGQVATKLIEDLAGTFIAGLLFGGTANPGPGRALIGAPSGGALVAREKLDHLLADTGQVRSELDQNLCGHALALTDQAEQNVLGTDVVVTELQSLT